MEGCGEIVGNKTCARQDLAVKDLLRVFAVVHALMLHGAATRSFAKNKYRRYIAMIVGGMRPSSQKFRISARISTVGFAPAPLSKMRVRFRIALVSIALIEPPPLHFLFMLIERSHGGNCRKRV